MATPARYVGFMLPDGQSLIVWKYEGETRWAVYPPGAWTLDEPGITWMALEELA